MDKHDVETQVIAYCKAHLIRYSVPTYVEVLDAMPRTKMAKINYKELEKNESNE